MRVTLRWIFGAAMSLLPLFAGADARTPNVVIQWNDAALQGVRDSKIGPPMVARALAIVHTCIYDAWAAYDQHALGTQLGGRSEERRVGKESRSRWSPYH